MIGKITPAPPIPKGTNSVTVTFTKPKRAVSRVFLHCSASDSPAHDDVAVMDKWHRERGFAEVGYHYFITKKGVLQIGRDIEKTPAAQQGHNTGTIAICLHGLKAANFTALQFTVLYLLCQKINAAYGGKVTFHGHKEVAAKDCPVFNYRHVLKLDAQGHMMPI